MTAKSQVQQAINMGLNLKQTQSKLKKLPKGTVSAYFYMLKKTPVKLNATMNPAPIVTGQAETKTFTKFELIDRIVDADMVNHQKKVFIRMITTL